MRKNPKYDSNLQQIFLNYLVADGFLYMVNPKVDIKQIIYQQSCPCTLQLNIGDGINSFSCKVEQKIINKGYFCSYFQIILLILTQNQKMNRIESS
ncbi:hypothetical protein pb186bvf_002878 [Paramecium bursaria]